MARELGKKSTYINNLEAGRKRPSIGELEATFIPYFGVDIIEFFIPR